MVKPDLFGDDGGASAEAKLAALNQEISSERAVRAATEAKKSNLARMEESGGDEPAAKQWRLDLMNGLGAEAVFGGQITFPSEVLRLIALYTPIPFGLRTKWIYQLLANLYVAYYSVSGTEYTATMRADYQPARSSVVPHDIPPELDDSQTVSSPSTDRVKLKSSECQYELNHFVRSLREAPMTVPIDAEGVPASIVDSVGDAGQDMKMMKWKQTPEQQKDAPKPKSVGSGWWKVHDMRHFSHL